jgi:hypothetical protein
LPDVVPQPPPDQRIVKLAAAGIGLAAAIAIGIYVAWPPTVIEPPTTTVVTSVPPATTSVPIAPAIGTTVIDATPWAEIVSVVNAAGQAQSIPAGAFTPLVLTLPAGNYQITLRNGKTQTVPATVDATGVTTIGPVDFGKVDAADYFRRQGLAQ